MVLTMRKKFIRATFVAAISMACGINVFNAQNLDDLSDIALANRTGDPLNKCSSYMLI